MEILHFLLIAKDLQFQHLSGLWIYDVYPGKELNLLFGYQEGDASVAYSPDGKMMAIGSLEGKLSLWDVSTGKVIRRFMGHQDEIRGVAFSPDGNILASCGARGLTNQ